MGDMADMLRDEGMMQAIDEAWGGENRENDKTQFTQKAGRAWHRAKIGNIWKVNQYYWNVYHHIDYNVNNAVTGKYLFFSKSRSILQKIVLDEIEHHDFRIGKISRDAAGKDHVLCLYWIDDSRKQELFYRYAENLKVKYRYWKSDADTRAGKYSDEHTHNMD